MNNEQKITLLLWKVQRKLKEREVRRQRGLPCGSLERQTTAIVKRIGVLERWRR
jgi:hypothetical protein